MTPLALLFSAIFFSATPALVAAQRGDNQYGYGGSPSSATTGVTGGYNISQSAAFKKSNQALIAHAVLGTLAWALFAPIGAIILRLNLPSVNLLRLHGCCQMFAYTSYVAAVGLGIYIANTASRYRRVWDDPHVIIGLLVFGLATVQPVLGYIHHVIFKRRITAFSSRVSGAQRPGRTVLTISHIYIGRILILLAVINGGLGLRLASHCPFQTSLMTRKAEIAYGVLAGSMFFFYISVTLIFERRRAARIRNTKVERYLIANSGHHRSSPGSSKNSSFVEGKRVALGD